MKLNEQKKILHLGWLIAGGFFLSVASFACAFFFPVDFSTDPPTFHPMIMVLGQMQTAFYILGCTGLGIKLAEEKKTIPSIGFTMMSIAQGVIFVLYLISVNSHEKVEEAFKMFSASLFLLIPSMILIAFYSEFPRWLNIAGILACVPYLVENIIFSFTRHITMTSTMIDLTGNTMFNIVAVCWGIIVLRNAGREAEMKREK